ncbi:MAG: hypothetical protein BroJett025_02970 [Patescibacteria group bacterium]|nr:MAG: hypothetical protein BroJett025_02970 [Patescibacteria group bacterium]
MQFQDSIIQSTLLNYFGYTQFRDGQLEIIKQIVQKKDCLAILPTGGGKSICFQIPGLLFPGITIVISPLISLMKDQVDRLNSKGISACYISSLLEKQQLESTYQLLKLNKYKFVYIAPERLESKRFQSSIKNLRVSLLVIDEAHCINQWGDTFRPSYKKIVTHTKQLFKDIPTVAFTATANKQVQKDISQTLQLNNPFVHYKSFKRTNLFIEVIHCHNTTIKNLTLLRLLKKHKNQVGIIYCATRKTTEKLAHYLNQFGFTCEYYHGGLDNSQKQQVQLAFCNSHTKIIVATNAFGMGVDISNIRFVVHYQIPGTIENYYQEIGRAGRDQNFSYCYSFYCQSDTTIQYELLKKFPKKIMEFEKIKKLFLKKKCRSQQILEYFGEASEKCDSCDVCNRTSYPTQLQIHITSTELLIIQHILSVRSKNKKIHRRFPITDTATAFLAILKPKTEQGCMMIPGIGIGFVSVWFLQIQHILAVK